MQLNNAVCADGSYYIYSQMCPQVPKVAVSQGLSGTVKSKADCRHHLCVYAIYTSQRNDKVIELSIELRG